MKVMLHRMFIIITANVLQPCEGRDLERKIINLKQNKL
jgi:hypothetical protein